MELWEDGTFEEYLVQSEGSQKQRAEHWQIAIGLQDVDHLKNSQHLLDIAKLHIDGQLNLADVQKRIVAYYQTTEGRKLAESRTDEADLVATQMMSILSEDTFTFVPTILAHLHQRIFKGVFKHAGSYRTVNLSKKEWVLDGESVVYAPYDLLQETIAYDFGEERQFSYVGLSMQDSIQHLAKFIAGIWQIHPFMEGNTRTTALFAILYLRKFGFQINNIPFREHAWYFRNALVRANYNNVTRGIFSTTLYLERFLENVILGAHHELKNRHCHVLWQGELLQSPKPISMQTCTLEEVAILNILEKEPRVTQKELAQRIGKSERTIKTLTKSLQEKQFLLRHNGARAGYWEVKR